MKNLMLFFMLLSLGVFAQVEESLETIYANESNNVALFFPSPVRQGIAGAENFIFSFNEDVPQYFGLLKAVPGKNSNLLVLTQDGQVYSYLLAYREELRRLNYFIQKEASIGNEVPASGDIDIATSENEKVALPLEKADSLARRITYLNNLSTYYLRWSKGSIKTKRKKGLVLRIMDMNYYKNELFMVFEVENKSRIDFQLNYLNVYLIQGNRKRNASFQKLHQVPIYTFEVPKVIKAKEKKKFLYVLPKFTVGDRERIEVEMREEQGSRYVKLRLDRLRK